MLKKIIIVILIIVSYRFIFDSINLVERCTDHIYLPSENSSVREPINISNLIVKKIEVYRSEDTETGLIAYYIRDPNSGFTLIDDYKINRFFEFLNQNYKKKKKTSKKYNNYSKKCQYENDYNPITFKKTWSNAANLEQLEKTIVKNRKKYKRYLKNAEKDLKLNKNLVSEENSKILKKPETQQILRQREIDRLYDQLR